MEQHNLHLDCCSQQGTSYRAKRREVERERVGTRVAIFTIHQLTHSLSLALSLAFTLLIPFRTDEEESERERQRKSRTD